jgi:hypothetical protein
MRTKEHPIIFITGGTTGPLAKNKNKSQTCLRN